MELSAFEGQNRDELSLIEVAHEFLVQKGEVIEFNELLIMIQEFMDFSEEELEASMVRFYTDLNIDGRFISLGENRWGLRLWYPIDSIDEETITSAEEDEAPKRRRKKRKLNAFADDDDMIDYNDDDPEDGESYDEDEDEEYDEDDDMDDIDDIVAAEDEDEDEELDDYATDLSEFEDDFEEDAEFDEVDDLDEEDDDDLEEYEDEEEEYEDD